MVNIAVWPSDELAAFLGCHPAFALWQLLEVPEDTRDPRLRKE